MKLLELIISREGKVKMVYEGPKELSITPKFTPFRVSDKGFDLQKKLKTRFKTLLNDYKSWINSQSKLSLYPDTDIKEFDTFSKLAIDKIFAWYEFILQQLNNSDWEQEIIEYTTFVAESFGQIPDQKGDILFLEEVIDEVIDLVYENLDIPDYKKEGIIYILNAQVDNTEITKSYHELVATFRNWIEALPFKLEFLRIDKKEYAFNELAINKLPFFNKYTNDTYFRLKTKTEMLSQLTENTFAILGNIDLEQLRNDKAFNEPDHVNLQLSEHTSKLKITKLTKQIGDGEIAYIDAIIACLEVVETHITKNKEILLSNNHSGDSNLQESESLKAKVEQTFSFMLNVDPRKHKVILQEDDYNNLVNSVTAYFENGLEIPEDIKPIKTINTNKGNVIWAFKDLFKELQPSSKLPVILFELITTCFTEYRSSPVSNLQKFPRPDYYDDLIKNTY